MPAIALVLGSAATFDAAYLAAGGLPVSLRKGCAVQLRSADVRIHTDGTTVRVAYDCIFVNRGPACFVRIGFPDQLWDGFDVNGPPEPNIKRFRARFDGSAIATQLVKGREPCDFWWAATIRFAAGQTRRASISFEQHVGIGDTETRSPVLVTNRDLVYARELAFLFGSRWSWNGPMAYFRMRVTFGTFLPSPLRIRRWTESKYGLVLDPGPKQSDVYTALEPKPRVHGRTLDYVRRNWTPDQDDYAVFLFGYRSYDQGPGSGP